MKLAQAIQLTEVAAGGPGSGRRPSGVSKEIHETLTKYGYKHTGGDIKPASDIKRGSANLNLMYRRPDGHSVAINRQRGVSDWSVHPKKGWEGAPGGNKTRVPGGHITPVGPYQGSGQELERLDRVLKTVQDGKAVPWSI